jgi:hypothetical protein
MDITDSAIGYVETMDYTDAAYASENDENINYDEQGIFYWN